MSQDIAPRLQVRKTYKNFVGGAFPRSESGRTYEVKSKSQAGDLINVSLSSRKDVRDAVTVARTAGEKWATTTAYNKGQILYRIAEILETRKAQLVDELLWQGLTRSEALEEVGVAVDRCVHYAGWSDKYQQVFGTVNPVASKHFNFTTLEPMGVVAAVAPDRFPLVGLISLLAPVIVGGNTILLLASEESPLSAVSLAEALATSDVPAGVVNIITGHRRELLPSLATHMEINALAMADTEASDVQMAESEASQSVKRIRPYSATDWRSIDQQGPQWILDFLESKTTWHPIGL